MKNFIFLSLITVLTICGCTTMEGIKYQTKTYSGTSCDAIRVQGKYFKVYDNVSQQKLMVVPSLGAAMGNGFISGFTGGAAPQSSSGIFYRKAAQIHLGSKDKKCHIVDGYLIVNPNWEFCYECEEQQ